MTNPSSDGAPHNAGEEVLKQIDQDEFPITYRFAQALYFAPIDQSSHRAPIAAVKALEERIAQLEARLPKA